MNRPNFFIVGAPKCGTTSLFEYLNQHPDVFIPENKEPHWFGEDLHHTNRPNSLEDYLSLFASANGVKRQGDASIWYLYSESAAKEIYEFEPDAKIIMMLRNPVSMIPSLHAQQLASWTEKERSFDRILKNELEHYSGDRKQTSCDLGKMPYIPVARYSEQIKRYRDLFPRENIKIIIFDDFKKDVKGCFEDVCEFLGLDSKIDVNFGVSNARSEPRSIALRDFLRTPPGFVVDLSKKLLPSLALRNKVKGVLLGWNEVFKPSSGISNWAKSELEKEFSNECDQLRQLIDEPLPGWPSKK